MTDIYLPLDEAAALESISYKGLQSRIKRNPQYLTKKEPDPNGGKPRVLVSLSSLSEKAQRIYKKGVDACSTEAVVEKQAEKEIPWYLDIDIHWYIENQSERYYQAVELADQIQRFVSHTERERTTYAKAYAERVGISQRSLYRYTEKYLEASAWAIKLEQENRCSYDYFKVLALCRKPKESGTFPSLPPEQRAYIENVWFNPNFAKNNSTIEMLYEKFEEKALEEGWVYPSYQTVARYINYLMNEKGYGNAHKLLKDPKAWKQNTMIKGIRDSSKVPVMGLIQGDAHTFDFWVKYTDPVNGKVSAIRPHVVAWIDTRSRKVMGIVMAKSISAQEVKHSLLKIAYQVGVPECILVDNGKEFTSKDITGRNRNQRSDHDPLIVLDREAKGFLKSLGIKDDYRSLPYQPWGKGSIERFFMTVCNQFSKWFDSYTGTLTGSKTAAKVEKDIDKMLARDELLTLEECYELFARYIENVYHQKQHRGLKSMKEKWTTPAELFTNAPEQYRKPAPDIRYAETLMQKAERVRVYNVGIKRFGMLFMDSALEPFIGKHVLIRWNPEDLSKVIAFDEKGKRICEAQYQPYLQYFDSQENIGRHKAKQNGQISRARQQIQQARTPYDQRGREKPVAGKLDIMVKNENPSNVISLPEDKQYREEIKEGTKKKKAVENDYFSQMGEDVLARMKAN